MPKRVIDFDAMWGSDKLASCADWAQAEYAWLYGLADASGCFEMTNLRVIWGRVAAVRGNFTIERLEQVFLEFQDKGLLFVWMHEGKRYAHWTGSDVPGRLPPPSWRMRLEKFAPPVPKLLLAEYMARFARGRAAMGGAGFRGESAAGAGSDGGNLKFEISDLTCARGGDGGVGNYSRETGLKGRVEGDQAQDLDLNLDLELKWNGNRDLELGLASGEFAGVREGREDKSQIKSGITNQIKNDAFYDSNARAEATATATAKATATANANAIAKALTGAKENSLARSSGSSTANLNSTASAGANSSANLNFNANGNSDTGMNCESRESSGSRSGAGADLRATASYMGNDRKGDAGYRISAREIAVERELRVGAGPVCGPVRIRPEVLERIRLREEARDRARAGTRAP